MSTDNASLNAGSSAAIEASSPEITELLRALSGQNAGRLTITTGDAKTLVVSLAGIALRQQQELEKLNNPPRASYGGLLDFDKWESILTHPIEAQRGEAWMRSFFAKGLAAKAGHQTTAIFAVLSAQMGLAASMPAVLSNSFFAQSSRKLIAEMIVAEEAATGMKPTALHTMRRSLAEEELPAQYANALQNARTHDKLMAELRPQPSAEHFRKDKE